MLSGIKEVLERFNNPEEILRTSSVELCGKDTAYKKKKKKIEGMLSNKFLAQ